MMSSFTKEWVDHHFEKEKISLKASAIYPAEADKRKAIIVAQKIGETVVFFFSKSFFGKLICKPLLLCEEPIEILECFFFKDQVNITFKMAEGSTIEALFGF